MHFREDAVRDVKHEFEVRLEEQKMVLLEQARIEQDNISNIFNTAMEERDSLWQEHLKNHTISYINTKHVLSVL